MILSYIFCLLFYHFRAKFIWRYQCLAEKTEYNAFVKDVNKPFVCKNNVHNRTASIEESRSFIEIERIFAISLRMNERTECTRQCGLNKRNKQNDCIHSTRNKDSELKYFVKDCKCTEWTKWTTWTALLCFVRSWKCTYVELKTKWKRIRIDYRNKLNIVYTSNEHWRPYLVSNILYRKKKRKNTQNFWNTHRVDLSTERKSGCDDSYYRLKVSIFRFSCNFFFFLFSLLFLFFTSFSFFATQRYLFRVFHRTVCYWNFINPYALKCTQDWSIELIEHL